MNAAEIAAARREPLTGKQMRERRPGAENENHGRDSGLEGHAAGQPAARLPPQQPGGGEDHGGRIGDGGPVRVGARQEGLNEDQHQRRGHEGQQLPEIPAPLGGPVGEEEDESDDRCEGG